jgi:hypothetical protein
MSTVYQAVEQDGSYTARCATFHSITQASIFKSSNPDLKLQRKNEALWEQMEGMAVALENASEATDNLDIENPSPENKILIDALDEAALNLRRAARLQKRIEPEGQWVDL